jgi:hypothetical protein
LSAFLPDGDTVGIVGGADRPTVNLRIRVIFNSAYSLLILFGLPTAFCSLFVLIFSRTIKKNCVISTTLTALALSACTALGVYSLLIFASCFIMTSPSNHPIALPSSICVGMMALIGFILLIVLYYKRRNKKPSIPGAFLDAAFPLCICRHFFFHILSFQIFYQKFIEKNPDCIRCNRDFHFM